MAGRYSRREFFRISAMGVGLVATYLLGAEDATGAESPIYANLRRANTNIDIINRLYRDNGVTDVQVETIRLDQLQLTPSEIPSWELHLKDSRGIVDLSSTSNKVLGRVTGPDEIKVPNFKFQTPEQLRAQQFAEVYLRVLRAEALASPDRFWSFYNSDGHLNHVVNMYAGVLATWSMVNMPIDRFVQENLVNPKDPSAEWFAQVTKQLAQSGEPNPVGTFLRNGASGNWTDFRTFFDTKTHREGAFNSLEEISNEKLKLLSVRTSTLASQQSDSFLGLDLPAGQFLKLGSDRLSFNS